MRGGEGRRACGGWVGGWGGGCVFPVLALFWESSHLGGYMGVGLVAGRRDHASIEEGGGGARRRPHAREREE